VFSSLQAAIETAQAQRTSLAQVALDAESRDQGRSVQDIRAALRRALDVMRGAVDRGMRGDLRSVSGLVGGDAAKLREGPPGPLSGTLFRDVLARGDGCDRGGADRRRRRRASGGTHRSRQRSPAR
jgi:L-serine dehydratase